MNMNNTIDHLQPTEVWSWFQEICKVPRPSKKEEKMIAFLQDFATQHCLQFKKDAVGNVLILKEATPGNEQKPTVVLQSHLDMVCEKNNDVQHDFNVDPIQPQIVDGWVKATGTTLGADDGIGIAAQLAVLSSKSLEHGKVECLFTVDEETGLTGAFALEPGFFEGKTLINLDSEDEGELFIGCAGGVDTLATFNFVQEPVPVGHFPIEIRISGLKGGHSGDDINKGRASANKLIARFLWQTLQKYPIRLAKIDGGNLRNAIAREASVVLMVPSALKESVVIDFNVFRVDVEHEFADTEPDMNLWLGSADIPDFVLDAESSKRLIYALQAVHHGVYRMSRRMPGMVETSTNLASVKITSESEIVVTTSQRSDVEYGKDEMAAMVNAVFTLAGAVSVVHSDGYPGWAPNPQSEILRKTVMSYAKLFGKEPIVRSIHAGLECGLFLKKYPGLDMVSFGPTIRDAHSPDEKIEIESVVHFWNLLTEVISK
jgi:dipeptidase D